METAEETQLSDIQVLEQEIRPQLISEDEKVSLEIQNSATFIDCIEISMNDRIFTVGIEELNKKRKNGTIPIFVKGLLHRFRDSRFRSPVHYSRMNLLDEINFTLRNIVAVTGRINLPPRGSGIVVRPVDMPKVASHLIAENKRLKEYLKKACLAKEKDHLTDDRSVDTLKIGSRPIRILKENGINTIGELRKKTRDEIEGINGISFHGANSIKNGLKDLGIDWG